MQRIPGVVVAQKELIPVPGFITELAIKRFMDRNRVIWDVDDAIWARDAGFEALAAVHARGANCVVAGNAVLAEWLASKSSSPVKVIPTCVLVPDEQPCADRHRQGEPVVLGWLGSPATSQYLHRLADSLLRIAANSERPVEFELMGGSMPASLRSLPWCKSIPWSVEGEAEFLKRIHIGLAPLPKGQLEDGKCGLKILQYMANGAAVCASDNEVQRTMIGKSGVLVKDADWTAALKDLIENEALRSQLAEVAYNRCRAHYSIDVGLAAWKSVLVSLAD